MRADNTVEQRKVTVALSNGDLAGVSAGLAEGEKVVVEGQASLTNGSQVTVKQTDGDTGTGTETRISQNGVAP